MTYLKGILISPLNTFYQPFRMYQLQYQENNHTESIISYPKDRPNSSASVGASFIKPSRSSSQLSSSQVLLHSKVFYSLQTMVWMRDIFASILPKSFRKAQMPEVTSPLRPPLSSRVLSELDSGIVLSNVSTLKSDSFTVFASSDP